MSIRSFKHAKQVLAELKKERDSKKINSYVWYMDLEWLKDQVAKLWDEKTYAEYIAATIREASLSRLERDGLHRCQHHKRECEERWAERERKDAKERVKREMEAAKREEEKELAFQALIDQAPIEPVAIKDILMHPCVSPEVHLSAEQISGLPWHDPWFDDPIEEEEDDDY